MHPISRSAGETGRLFGKSSARAGGKRLLLSVFFIAFVVRACNGPETRKLSVTELRDKIEGGWAGQMIGVSFGFPTEFRYRGEIITGELPEWTPEQVREALRQDDIYIEMTFARVVDHKGLTASTEEFADAFRSSEYRLWHASQAARRALRRGVAPHLTGTLDYNAHAQDISLQIFSDFIGLMSPGLPRSAQELSARIGTIFACGDGIYAGLFTSGMYAAAFFEDDPRRIVESGLVCLPPESDYAAAIREVLGTADQFPSDWTKAWQAIEHRWGEADVCPYGVLAPLSIDARVNGAYVALALVYGKGDFERTLEIATRCGQDSDCNPSTAGGILGTAIGFSRIPPKWTAGIAGIRAEKFEHTAYSFDSIVESSLKSAMENVRLAGGSWEGEWVRIRLQKPEPFTVPDCRPSGQPVERINCDDPRWHWEGRWDKQVNAKSGPEMVASEEGATAAIRFEGTGAMIVGPYLGAGGRADIFLDGHLHRTIDVYPDQDERKANEAVWHVFGLVSGPHEIKVRVCGEPYHDSKGSEIRIQDLVVFVK
jgi:hypothetical protein